MPHDELMLDGGFTIVSNKRIAKKGRILKPVRIEGTISNINEALSQATSSVKKSGFCEWLQARLEECLPFLDNGSRMSHVERILLLGNGHFDAPWEPGSHQLALIKQVAERLDVIVEIQDPCFTEAEIEWIGASPRFKHVIDVQTTAMSSFHTTLIICIHSPHFLVDDLLKNNWKKEILSRLIFLGNDYSTGSLNDPSCRNLSFFAQRCKYFPFPRYEPNPSIFYQTSIYSFQSIEDKLPSFG